MGCSEDFELLLEASETENFGAGARCGEYTLNFKYSLNLKKKPKQPTTLLNMRVMPLRRRIFGKMQESLRDKIKITHKVLLLSVSSRINIFLKEE